MKNFIKILPEEIKNGLAPFVNYLKEKHTVLYQRLGKELESEQYKTLIKDWYQFLNTPVKPDNKLPGVEESVLKTAMRVIRKQYRVVVESGLLIREDSLPDTLHSLRIECKKLRYLLEFFFSLFPKKTMKKIISWLKALQDNLGTYQDLQVQQKMISDFFDVETTGGRLKEDTEKAMCYLMEHFKKEEVRIRGEYYSLFKQFISREVQSGFSKICGQDTGL
jgi:CHAD domain-containing protein